MPAVFWCCFDELTTAWGRLQERVVTFVVRQEEGSETISKAALLQFLQHEYEVGLIVKRHVAQCC